MWSAITYIFLSIPSFGSAYLVDDVQQTAFENSLKDNNLVLAAFTSKSLNSLAAFNNVFGRAAEASETPFLNIDCERESNLCKEQDVHTYPAIRLYKRNENGTEPEMKRYRGRKTEHAYVDGTLYRSGLLTKAPATESSLS